ncbi:MAG: Rab family GTPase [Planctomycetota bacterium]
MSALQKKVCMLGAFAVGKTSLVAQFVHRKFSDRYLTTLGVKVDKRTVAIDGRELNLILWDLAGEDDLSTVRSSYLRGLHGCIVVIDGTRGRTLEVARDIRARVASEQGASTPMVFVVNKLDLAAEWEIEEAALTALEAEGVAVVRASAKTGEGVAEAFAILARGLLESSER